MKETRDILSLFEALNNHEVFTPPRIARAMLDLIPGEVWSNPATKVLDPCTKSGVFLREAFYKIYEALKGNGAYKDDSGKWYDFSNHQDLINHILRNMLFGIATSELTGYVARRTLYGVMEANVDKQIAAVECFEKSSNYRTWTETERLAFIGRNKFNDYYDHKLFAIPEYSGFEAEGNIFYPAAEVRKKVYELESFEIEDTYFPFIESSTEHAKIIDIRSGKMKFDVIIGNPPYQVSDGGFGASARPLYHEFVDQAKKLNPRYISMIIPARWYAGGRVGDLTRFRDTMLRDTRLKELHDFANATDCFPGVQLKGGVNYFLWDNSYNGPCEVVSHSGSQVVSRARRYLLEEGFDTFIRDNEAISIIEKVRARGESSFSELVSANDPFGFDVRVKGSMKRVKPDYKLTPFLDAVYFYYNGWRKTGVGYIDKKYVRKNIDWLEKPKLFVPKAIGSGDRKVDLIKPFQPELNSCSSETYLVIGPFETDVQLRNAKSYINTKFFHFLVSLKKITQEARRGVYEFVPSQDFNEEWDDIKLYKKYGLSSVEVRFIEENVRDMDKDVS